MQTKSKAVAYVLWFFFGLIGAHKFYIGKVGMGVIYLLTGGIFGIGWIIDLFTLSNQVDLYNALHRGGGQEQSQQQNQNIVVNVGGQEGASQPKTTPEKEILQLAEEKPQLSLQDIVSKTSLSVEDAESTLERMEQKGLIKETVSSSGKKMFDASQD